MQTEAEKNKKGGGGINIVFYSTFSSTRVTFLDIFFEIEMVPLDTKRYLCGKLVSSCSKRYLCDKLCRRRYLCDDVGNFLER